MISITQKMRIPEDDSLVIITPDGEYADTDLILCAERSNVSLPTAQFQAQYIKYGAVVYQFNTPEALGAALFAIDPESTHDAVALYREEEARRIAREKGTLKPEDPVAAPDALQQEVPVDQQSPVEEERIEEVPVTEQPPEESPTVPELPADNTSSTTPSIPEPEAYDPSVYGEALVPPPTAPEVPSVDVAPEIPAVDVSTTSPE